MAEWRGVDLSGLTIEADGLRLRPVSETDVPTIVRAMHDRRMHEYLPLPDPYTPDSAHEFVESRVAARADGLELASAIEVDGELCGTAGIRLPQARRATGAEIGYSVYPWAQGAGIAARTARVLAGWAFEHDVARVFIRSAVGNLASVKSALNAGFRFEGVARADIAGPSGARDSAVFGRIPADDGAPVAPRLAALPADGLGDGTIVLRPLLPSDAQAFHDERADAEVLRWDFSDDLPSAQESRSLCERAGLEWLVGPQARMAIIDAASGEMAGSIMLRQVGPPGTAMAGYGLRPAWRGRRFTARALRLLRSWALAPDGGGLHRLELGAKVANVASLRAAAAGGFLEEGVLAERLRNPDGSFSDEVQFGVLN